MFLEYLDSKTEYLKTKVRPLNTHELKKINFLDAAVGVRFPKDGKRLRS